MQSDERERRLRVVIADDHALLRQGLASMLEAQGFRGLRDWGKYLHTMQVTVKVQNGDYNFEGVPEDLPHVSKAIAQLQDAGYKVGAKVKNHGGQWVIIGRRYDDKP